MNIIPALQLCLLLHLSGLVTTAGMSVTCLVMYKNFWRQYADRKEQAIILFSAISLFQRYRIAGAIVLLITGVIMMVLTHGVLVQQLWMKIKLALVVLLAITGPFFISPQAKKIKNILIDDECINNRRQIRSIKERINYLIILELLLLFSIVFLSVFKIN